MDEQPRVDSPPLYEAVNYAPMAVAASVERHTDRKIGSTASSQRRLVRDLNRRSLSELELSSLSIRSQSSQLTLTASTGNLNATRTKSPGTCSLSTANEAGSFSMDKKLLLILIVTFVIFLLACTLMTVLIVVLKTTSGVKTPHRSPLIMPGNSPNSSVQRGEKSPDPELICPNNSELSCRVVDRLVYTSNTSRNVTVHASSLYSTAFAYISVQANLHIVEQLYEDVRRQLSGGNRECDQRLVYLSASAMRVNLQRVVTVEYFSDLSDLRAFNELENVAVRYTLNTSSTLGLLQSRFRYQSGMSSVEVRRTEDYYFIPSGLEDDNWFPFPLLQEVRHKFRVISTQRFFTETSSTKSP